jgi:hypothetical protein
MLSHTKKKKCGNEKEDLFIINKNNSNSHYP